ncbi:hypothetical protein P8C59_006454 [Phyllachora maydis]|uniref:Uncharacterized protein n=1 Tax=Phyllachora maydis TaxID=1825666 RepID=A0AAD9MFI9_9PEZI|nr:hypothetical protein P8C59_006454 [Phyllachora maydis]
MLCFIHTLVPHASSPEFHSIAASLRYLARCQLVITVLTYSNHDSIDNSIKLSFDFGHGNGHRQGKKRARSSGSSSDSNSDSDSSGGAGRCRGKKKQTGQGSSGGRGGRVPTRQGNQQQQQWSFNDVMAAAARAEAAAEAAAAQQDRAGAGAGAGAGADANALYGGFYNVAVPSPPWPLFLPFATAAERQTIARVLTLELTVGKLLEVYNGLLAETAAVDHATTELARRELRQRLRQRVTQWNQLIEAIVESLQAEAEHLDEATAVLPYFLSTLHF